MRYRFTLSNPIKGTEILSQEPRNWQDIDIVFKRDSKYHGIFREITIELEFYHGAGMDYILDVYETQGINGQVFLYIDIDFNGSGNYESFYQGELKLSSLRTYGNLGQRDCFLSVNITEIGITQIVKDRLSTKVDLSTLETLDGTALSTFAYGPYDLNLHSKAIIQRSNFLPTDSSFTSTGFNNGSDVFFNMPMFPEISEIDTSNSTLVNYISGAGTTEKLIVASQNYDLIESEYRIKGSVTLNGFPSNAKYTIDEFKLTQSFNGVGTDIYSSDSGGQFQGSYTFNFDVNGTTSHSSVSSGAIFTFVFTLRTAPPDDPDVDPLDNFPFTITLSIDEANTFANFTSISTTDATTCKAFAIHEAGARISQYITNQTDAFRSDFFGRKNSEPVTYSENGCGSFGAITNGFQIRKFPIADRPVFISLEDFYEGLNAIYNLGLSIEEGGSGYVIRIEPKEYFYSTDVLFQIKNIPNMEVSIAERYYYNKVEIGYHKWEIELTGGLDEFNSKRQYTLPIKVNNTLTQYSKLVAGGYPLETARRKLYIDESTTDYEYDNENFIICLNRSTDGSGNPNTLDTAEKDENFVGATNILSPETSYNLRISPARNVLRWNNIISPSLIKNPGESLKFTYGEGNSAMDSEFDSDNCEGNYNNEPLVENQNIQWDGVNTGNPPLWIPELYEFDYPLSFTEYKTIKSNPTKCLEISRTSSDFIKAFIIEIRYEPNKGMANFKLLRANG